MSLQPSAASGFDRIAADLTALRTQAGEPSYAEIVRRVTELRVARGEPVERARPARTTVYELFRPGRSRMDGRLVADVALALGADPQQADAWVERCRRARAATESAEPSALPGADAVDPESSPEAVGSEDLEAARGGVGRRLLATVLLGSLLINVLGRGVVYGLDLHLHLDMIGTALAAIALGPWWGALVGVLSNISGAAISGPASLPFALVNVAGALAWGYGVRRFGWGRSLSRFFALCLATAVLCSLVATPILVLVLDGGTGYRELFHLEGFAGALDNAFASAFADNVVISAADKLVSGFVALAVVDAGARWWGSPLREPAGEERHKNLS